MKNLFNDDILLDDNDVTSVLDDTGVTSLYNLVNNNLNYLKSHSYLNDIDKRYDAYDAYINSFKGYEHYKDYFDIITYEVNNPYSISLNIKGLDGEKYHRDHIRNCLLGVIDTNIIKSIPHITNINIEPLYDFYAVNERSTNILMFMTLTKYKDLNKSNLIDDIFIENIKEFIENFKDNNIDYMLIFDNVIFEYDSIKKLNNILLDNMKICISCNCKIHLPNNILEQYKHIEQLMYVTTLANMYSFFDNYNKIKFDLFPIFKNLK